MTEMAIQATMTALKAKFKRQKKRHDRPEEEYRELAEKVHAKSIASGPTRHLGNGELPRDAARH